MALLIIAIVSAIAIGLSRLQQLDVRRTSLMMTSEQAYLYAQGVEYWAQGRLILMLQGQQAAQPTTIWPIVLPPTRIANGQGSIMGSIQDAQGLFNLNNFVRSAEVSPPSSKPGSPPAPKAPSVDEDSPSQKLFIRILSSLGLSMSVGQQKNLITAISAWVSASGSKNPNTFDQQYARMNPPYRSPHARMVSISELRTVAGVTPSIYNRLAPYLTALPDTTPFVIQRAPRFLQQALQSTEQNQTQGGEGGQTSLGNYFLLRADVYLQDQHLILYSMLQRSNQPDQPPVTVLWRSLGTQ